MNRYAKINKNDVANGKGVCVSFWVQGCHFRCPGCHNKDTWDFEGGKEFTDDVIDEVIEAIPVNGIQRNLSILGGEPLAWANLIMVERMISAVRYKYPNIKIYMWTGYKYEDLMGRQIDIVNSIDYLIDGQFMEDLKDININYAGSSNQRIIDVQATKNSQELKTLDNL